MYSYGKDLQPTDLGNIGDKTKSRMNFNQPALHYVAEKAGMGGMDKDKVA